MKTSDIPVCIINRNRVTSTRKLVDWLRSHGMRLITIMDNDSSYPPLLEWYKRLPKG